MSTTMQSQSPHIGSAVAAVPSRSGAALVIVLVVIIAITGLMAGLTRSLLADYRQRKQLQERMQLEILVDDALAITRGQLANEDEPLLTDAWTISPDSWNLKLQGEIQVTVSPAAEQPRIIQAVGTLSDGELVQQRITRILTIH